MSREEIQELLPLIPDEHIETLYNFVMTLIPEEELTPEELEAFEEGLRDIEENGGTRHEDINWK